MEPPPRPRSALGRVSHRWHGQNAVSALSWPELDRAPGDEASLGQGLAGYIGH
jgi:hypothetical protein